MLHYVCYLNRRTYLVRKEEVQGDESRGESESGDLAEARRKKRWADEITPAGLLALAA